MTYNVFSGTLNPAQFNQPIFQCLTRIIPDSPKGCLENVLWLSQRNLHRPDVLDN